MYTQVLDMGSHDKIIINVGGQRHETLWVTLAKYPLSRLGALTSCDTEHDEVFFDRNPKLFPHILDFYRTGCLHFPHNICGPRYTI